MVKKDITTIKEEVSTGCEDFQRFFNLPYEEQLIEYFHKKNTPIETIVRYENSEKYLSFEKVRGEISFTGKQFFSRYTTTHKFTYNKQTKRTTSRYYRSNLLYDLTLFSRFDWLKNELENKHIHYKVLSDSVVRDILWGKLTNVEDIVKQYLKTLRVGNIDWKVYVEYLYSRCSLPVNWLKSFTTDVNETMKVLSGDNYYKLEDLIRKGLCLGKVINPRWSHTRMLEEYNCMRRLLSQRELEKKEQTPIYEECPTFNYLCKILNTEREVFLEGQEMSNCIYRNYWNRIKNHRYLVFSFTEPERITLGLKRGEQGFEYDEALTTYNKPISEKSKELITKFLNEDDVVDRINKLENMYPPISDSPQNDNYEEYEDYEDNELPY